jgi:hypothetical protein
MCLICHRRKPVPKHVHESRPIVPTQRTPPKDPNAIFEPFQLASVELHNKKVRWAFWDGRDG